MTPFQPHWFLSGAGEDRMFRPMKPTSTFSLTLCATLLTGSLHFAHAADALTAGQPLALAGTHGRFDFLTIDADGRRLLAAHTGNNSLDVIDLDKAELVKAVPTGAAQSAAVDAKAKRYYVAVSNPPQMAIVDAAKLEVIGKVPLSGPADLMAFNAKNGLAYVGHDDAKEVWVIDPMAKKITAAIALAGEGPEDIVFDATEARAFQAVKTKNSIAVVDTATNQVHTHWPTAPLEGPHGMALAANVDALLVAGSNARLALLSLKDGHVIASAEIAKGVDQMAYDAGLHRAYCACSSGKISVYQVDKDKLTSLGDVTSPQGARSVAVDQKTHTVWIAYAKGDASFVQPFTTTAAK